MTPLSLNRTPRCSACLRKERSAPTAYVSGMPWSGGASATVDGTAWQAIGPAVASVASSASAEPRGLEGVVMP